jgi:hypothetical protein
MHRLLENCKAAVNSCGQQLAVLESQPHDLHCTPEYLPCTAVRVVPRCCIQFADHGKSRRTVPLPPVHPRPPAAFFHRIQRSRNYLVDEGVLATACFNDRRLSGADSSVVMRGEHYRSRTLSTKQPASEVRQCSR